MDCLLQIHIASEDTKFGFDYSEVTEMLETAEFLNLRNVRICGLMGMATFTDNAAIVSKKSSLSLRNISRILMKSTSLTVSISEKYLWVCRVIIRLPSGRGVQL